jgi:F-type H+-transporting ATPase subunit b
MDATLHQLGEILLKALPTFLLVILLHYYLKFTFFRPMGKVLKQRWEATEGARKQADESMKKAAAKIAEYEAAIRSARAEIYHEQEKLYKELASRHAEETAAAHQRAEAAVRQAREELAKDVEAVKGDLERDSDRIAEEIAATILRSAA